MTLLTDEPKPEGAVMKVPIAVTFHGMSHSAWIEAEIVKRASKLEVYCRRLTSCRVVVTIPHRHHEEGNRFSVRIDLTVPGEELAVTREANVHGSRKQLGETDWHKQFDVESPRKDVGLVIRQAFDAAKRQLQQYMRRHQRAKSRVKMVARLAS